MPTWFASAPAGDGHVEKFRGVALKDWFRNLAEQVSNQANSGYRKIRVETGCVVQPPGM